VRSLIVRLPLAVLARCGQTRRRSPHAVRCTLGDERELRERFDHDLRRAKEDAGVGFGEHRGVVVGVTRGDDPEVELFEALHRFPFLVLHPQPVAGDRAVGSDDEVVAKEGGPTELSHQGARQLLEGIGKDDHLVAFAQTIQKGFGAR
jgi:hypothetical protein